MRNFIYILNIYDDYFLISLGQRTSLLNQYFVIFDTYFKSVQFANSWKYK